MVQLFRVDPIPVMDQVSVWVLSGQRFAELLQRPFRCGMGGHIVMHDPACSDFHGHKHVEDAEGRRHDHKEVARYNRFGMISDEGHPTLLRVGRALRAPSVGQIFADAPRRNANSQFELKFVRDAGFAPNWVVSRHGADKLPQVARQFGPPPRSGLPPPEQAESFPMPSDERFGPDHAECFAPLEQPG
jgi:hypothetical protein